MATQYFGVLLNMASGKEEEVKRSGKTGALTVLRMLGLHSAGEAQHLLQLISSRISLQPRLAELVVDMIRDSSIPCSHIYGSIKVYISERA